MDGISHALGITLDHLHIQTTDDDWIPTFLKVGQRILHKIATLKNFSIYYNTGDALNLDYEELEKKS